MDIDNLYKVMKLYLDKEDNGAAILTITKYSDVVDFSFSMTNYPEDLTIVSVNKANVDVDLLINVIRSFKGDLLVIDDKYDFNKEKNICKYESIFNTGREIIFKNFKLEEVNFLRNVIYNIDIYDNDIRIELEEEKEEIPYNARLRVSGYSSYITIFLVALAAIDIIMVALWIFKYMN